MFAHEDEVPTFLFSTWKRKKNVISILFLPPHAREESKQLHSTKDSTLASLPAAPGSNLGLGIPKFY